ncbi:MAG: hypothetical protein AB7S71_16315 [Dongiaceae bacterium]
MRPKTPDLEVIARGHGLARIAARTPDSTLRWLHSSAFIDG